MNQKLDDVKRSLEKYVKDLILKRIFDDLDLFLGTTR
jgi:hypothetical protein